MKQMKEGLRFGRATIKTDPKVLAFFNARGGTVLAADRCLLAGGKFGSGGNSNAVAGKNGNNNLNSITAKSNRNANNHNNLISRTLSSSRGGLINMFLSRFSNAYAEKHEAQLLLSSQNSNISMSTNGNSNGFNQAYFPRTSNKGRAGINFPRAEDVVAAAQEMIHQNMVLIPNNQLLEIQLTDKKMNTMDDLCLDLNFLLIGSRQNLR
jgi:ABC-type oligopeptide transport system substrate-binding subunit